MAGAGAAGLAPTITIGAGCVVSTGGFCAAGVVPAVVVEGGMVVVGGATLAHGTMIMARNKSNPGDPLGKAWNSHSGERRVIRGDKVGIDWEAPGRTGRVHVQVGDDHYYITDPSDLSGLPKYLQTDAWVQRQVERAYEMLQKHLQSLPPAPKE